MSARSPAEILIALAETYEATEQAARREADMARRQAGRPTIPSGEAAYGREFAGAVDARGDQMRSFAAACRAGAAALIDAASPE